MHVLQLSDLYSPVIGGQERHVATLSRELIRLGHTVTVVTLQPGGLPAEETVDGVRVIRIRGWSRLLASCYSDASRPFHPTAPDPGAVAALHRVVRRERPAVVATHSWLEYSYFALYHPHEGPAHVVTLHDYGLGCVRKTLMRAGHPGKCPGPRLNRCLLCAPEQYGVLKGTAVTAAHHASRPLHSRADRYIAVSKAVAEGSRQAVPARSEIVVVPAMVPNDLAAMAEAAPRPGFLPAADGYLMFAGALGPHKGVDVLVAAHRRMRHQLPLVLIGTPRRDTPPVDGPGVVVACNVPSSQVMASWARASIAVVPSVVHEGMGLVAIEAMLAGRPVVASDVGGLGEVVHHGVTGLLVPPGDPGALAATLDSLLDDPAGRQRMGQAGRTHARRFEAASVAPRVLAVYEDALRGRGTGSRGDTRR